MASFLARVWNGDDDYSSDEDDIAKASADAMVQALAGDPLAYASPEDACRRIQCSIRGFLIRRRFYRIQVRAVEVELRKLTEMEQGFTAFLLYASHFFLFLYASYLRADVLTSNEISIGILDFLSDIHFTDTPDGNFQSFANVQSLEDIRGWLRQFFGKAYTGTQMEYPCNSCSLFSSVLASSCNATSGGGLEPYSPADAQLCETYSYCADGTCDDFDPFETPNGDLVTASSYGRPEIPSSSLDCSRPLSEFWADPGPTYYRSEFMKSNGTVPLVPSSSQGAGTIAEMNVVLSGVILYVQLRKEVQCGDLDVAEPLYGPCLSSQYFVTDDLPYPEELTHINAMVGNTGQDILPYNSDIGGHIRLVDVGVFNVGFLATQCVIEEWTSSLIISNATARAGLMFVTYNGNQNGHYALVSVDFEVTLGGRVRGDESITVLRMGELNFDLRDRMRMALQLIFIIWLILYILKDLRILHLEMGRYRKAVSVAKKKDGQIIKAVNAGESAPPSSGKIKEGGRKRHGKIHTHLSVAQRHDTLNPWMLAIRWSSHLLFLVTALFWIVLPKESESFDPVSLTYGTLSIPNLTSVIVSVRDSANLVLIYDTVFCVASLVGLVRLLAHLSFHKRLSMVTSTLSAAAWSLTHFFLLLFLVLCIFAFICCVILGSVMDDFSTWGSSLTRLWRLAMGEVEDFYDRVLRANSSLGLIIVILFELLVGLLLLNVLISLIIGAYESVAIQQEGSDTIAQSLYFYCYRKLVKGKRWIKDWACGRKKWKLRGGAVLHPHSEEVLRPDETFTDDPTHMKALPPRGIVDGKFMHLREARAVLLQSPAPKSAVNRILSRLVFDKTFSNTNNPVKML